MVELTGVTVRFGDQQALDGVDLSVGDGEVVAVLGPSGSGKSTLLRAIAGLVPLDGGRITRDGADLTGVAPHARGFGLMFQDHALFPHRDVLANVGFGLRMRGDRSSAIDARAREMLELVGLHGTEHRRVHELSGGEQQRVALARALAPEPDLLMLDEPLGSLDRSLRERLAEELRAVFRRIKIGVLIVTHDQDEAFALADRIAVLDGGRIVQAGTPTELWRHPATPFVADFLGWTVTDALDGRFVAIRPDAPRLAPATETGGAESVEGTVGARTFRRDHWRLRVDVDGASEPWALAVEVRGPDAPAIDTRVRVSIDPDGVIGF